MKQNFFIFHCSSFFHVLSFSFIFFHVLSFSFSDSFSFCFFLFLFLFVRSSKSDFFWASISLRFLLTVLM